MKITIVGTINLDHIVSPVISRSGLGGILYNLAACAYLSDTIQTGGPGPLFMPVAVVGVDRWEEIREVIKSLPGTGSSGIVVDGLGINETWLHYDDQGARSEKLAMRVRSLVPQDVVPHADADAVLVNFISGRDLEVATLAEIRKACSGLVLMDIQSLSLGFGEGGERFLRPIPDWAHYARQVDVVKGNEQEIRLFCTQGIAGGPLSRIAASIMEQGPHVVIATQGARGSTAYWKERGNADRGVHKVWVSAKRVSQPLDVTGCGDVYASAFLMNWLVSRSVAEAAQFASEAAGYCAASMGIEALHGLTSRPVRCSRTTE